jgi:PAS domain S-box-containing protein
MKAPAKPANEDARLHALGTYEILDTWPEAGFDALTHLAATILDVPIALISIVDADRQWFKSRYGLDAPQTERAVSFCGHVVAGEAPLIVPDAYLDERFADNPLVTGGPRVRFYAGMPLRTDEGFILGTLCAIDHQPRELTATQQQQLALLATQVVAQLELRRRARFLTVERAATDVFRRFFHFALDLMCTIDDDLQIIEANPAWERQLGWTRADLRARPLTELLHPDDLGPTLEAAEQLIAAQAESCDLATRIRHRDGRWLTLRWSLNYKAGTFFGAARVADAA